MTKVSDTRSVFSLFNHKRLERVNIFNYDCLSLSSHESLYFTLDKQTDKNNKTQSLAIATDAKDGTSDKSAPAAAAGPTSGAIGNEAGSGPSKVCTIL